MPVWVEVRGTENLRRAAAQLRAEADAMQHNIVDAVDKATSGFVSYVARQTPTYLPAGYAPVMARSLRQVTTTRLGPDAGVSLRLYAVGRTAERDVERIDLGVLRHPLFGNRLHWYGQKVTAGFVRNPFKAKRPDIVRAIDAALNDIRQRVERG
jgi:hypothetical protein